MKTTIASSGALEDCVKAPDIEGPVCDPNSDTSHHRLCGGFTVIEFTMISVLLSVGLMGFMGAILTAHVMVRTTQAQNEAGATVASVVEQFRRACTEDFDLALTDSIGKTLYYRTRVGNFDVDVGDKEYGTAPVATTMPIDTIPTSLGLDTVGTKSTSTDKDGNSHDTTVFVDTDGTKYLRTVTTMTTGSVIQRDERFDPDGSTSATGKTTYSSGKTWSMSHAYDASTKVTTYTNSDQSQAFTKPGLNLFGTSMIDSNGESIELLSRDCLVDFDSLSSIGRNAKLTVSVLVDETTIDPPVDLNGDGDYLDSNLPAAELNAAILRVVVTWNEKKKLRKLEYSTILARGEMR